MVNNKDKNPKIDESLLEETPPNINEPQTPVEESEEPKEEAPVNKDSVSDSEPQEQEEETPEVKEPSLDNTPQEPKETETDDQKEQRYKAQQTEAQIQSAKNKSFISKVDEANQIKEPTQEDLRAFVAQDGANWEDLTPYEQATAKRTYLAEKRLQVINQAVQSTKEIDQWATTVDDFIDQTDGKPAYVKLSGHEADFRKFAMQESHRGTPIDILLGAFLYKLPAPEKKRGSIFQIGGGGEKTENTTKITDTDTIRTLRENNPREYARQIKAGKIQVEA